MTDITPSPPRWRHEQLQKMDKLFNQWVELENHPPQEALLIPNIPRYNEENTQIRNSPEFKKAVDKYFAKRSRITQFLRDALTYDDQKIVAEWLNEYLEKYIQAESEHKFIPSFDFLEYIPWGIVDRDLARQVYEIMSANGKHSDLDIEKYYPGLSRYK
jgi:hypothetical protein